MKEFVEILLTNCSLANKKLVYGVGINDAPYNIHINGLMCPYYKVWSCVIRRCYEPRKGWEDCIVCKEWLKSFMSFRAWMELQNWKHKVIDKDILVLGNKEYGPNTCVFVSQYLNTLFQQTNKNRKLPRGIYQCVLNKKYKVNCSIKPGVNKCLGFYTSLEKANEVYVRAKAQVLANEFKNILDTKVKDGLYKQLLNLDKENKIKLNNIST